MSNSSHLILQVGVAGRIVDFVRPSDELEIKLSEVCLYIHAL